MNATGTRVAGTIGGIDVKDWVVRVRAYLTQHPTSNLSTYDVMEQIWPEHTARGDLILERKKLFRYIMRQASEGALTDCATPGPAKTLKFGRQIKPWVWHAPRPRCEFCNGTGFAL